MKMKTMNHSSNRQKQVEKLKKAIEAKREELGEPQVDPGLIKSLKKVLQKNSQGTEGSENAKGSSASTPDKKDKDNPPPKRIDIKV